MLPYVNIHTHRPTGSGIELRTAGVHPWDAATQDAATLGQRLGGAQAVAAMAYGTESIPRVDKIFGPGNRYVTKAKQLVGANDVTVDLPAGPSEVLVLADDEASPAFAAADLLSQAEHGGDSQTVLVCPSVEFALSLIHI
mgnify:FL=1